MDKSTSKINYSKMLEMNYFLEEFCKQLKRTIDLESNSEKFFQMVMVDLLLENNLKAFMEYPYPNNSKDECDVVICKNNFKETQTWIEIKPLWSDSNYWSPSKFLKEAPFKHDIEKLNRIYKDKKEDCWFITIIFSNEEINLNNVENPRARKRLKLSQIVKILNVWNNHNYNFKQFFKTNKSACNVIAWNVKEYKDCIKEKDGQYLF